MWAGRLDKLKIVYGEGEIQMNKLRTRPDLWIVFFMALLALILIVAAVATHAPRLPYVVNY